MKNYTRVALSLSALAVLVGCGSSGPDTVSAGTGYYEDGAIVGVDYKCGSRTGVTGEKGVFKFDFNKSCEFKIGDVLLEKRDSSEFKRDNSKIRLKDENAGSILALLDVDGNPNNGFTIEEDAAKTALKDINLTDIDDLNISNTSDINKLTENYKNHLKKHKDTYKKPDIDKLKEEVSKHQENQTKGVLAGKTFYVPSYDINENGKIEKAKIEVLKFDNNMSKLTIDKDTYTVKLDGNNIEIGSKESYKISGLLDGKYIQFEEVHGYDRIKLYINKSDAELRLKEIKDNHTITETKVKSLIGKTLYEAEVSYDENHTKKLELTKLVISNDTITAVKGSKTKSANYEISGDTITVKKNNKIMTILKVLFISDEKIIWKYDEKGQIGYSSLYFDKSLAIEHARVNYHNDNSDNDDED